MQRTNSVFRKGKLLMPEKKKPTKRSKPPEQAGPKELVINLDADALNADWLHVKRGKKRPTSQKPERDNA